MINTYIRDISEALVQAHAALMVGAAFSKNPKKITPTNKRFWIGKSCLICSILLYMEKMAAREKNIVVLCG